MLLGFGVGLPLLIFGMLAVGIWANGGLFPGDVAILQALHQTQTQSLDAFAEGLTAFGIEAGVVPAAAAIAVFLLLQRQRETLLFWLYSGLGSSVLGISTKLIWQRTRPYLWDSLYPYPKDFSFPSGHAMASMTITATLVVLLWETRWRLPALGLGGLFVLGIGWTRLYLGVHYPSDVVAGWMLAIAWVIGLTFIIGLKRLQLNRAGTKSRLPLE
jgi:membrane-associated phospholipid phosphatase